MGDGIPNENGSHDIQTDGNGGPVLVAWTPKAHQTTLGVDSSAPHPVGGTALATLISASGSQVAFDAAASSEWPTWYSGVASTFGPTIRASLRRLAGLA